MHLRLVFRVPPRQLRCVSISNLSIFQNLFLHKASTLFAGECLASEAFSITTHVQQVGGELHTDALHRRR